MKVEHELAEQLQDCHREKAELLDSQILWKEIFDTIDDAITIHDKEFNVIDANRAASKLLGLPASRIFRQKCYLSYHGTKCPPSKCASCQTLLTGKPSISVVFEPHLNRYIEVKALPRLDEEKQIIGVVHIVRDVDDQVRAEEQEKRLKSQLLQVQKMEAIGGLAAGIAHEINTPTQYIGDNLHFLAESFADLHKLIGAIRDGLPEVAGQPAGEALIEKLKEIGEEIDLDYLLREIPTAIQQSREGNKRVAEIVQAMKAFSHPYSSTPTPTDLNFCLGNTIAVARNAWKYVAELETEFAPDLPLVAGQPGELNQVFLNLIVNAAHAIEEKVGRQQAELGKITISTRQDRDWVEIRFRDTGKGIPPQIRERIFEPFFTTKEVGRGTGQGLAIAHAVIVDKHHGTITVESEPGEGATFILRLPIDSPEEM